MHSLVRFRHLFDTLSYREQKKAIQKIATACSMQWIMSLIFNHFAQKILNNEAHEESQIAAITKAISDIITSRKKQKNNNNQSHSLSIESLPPVMISNVSSYLNQSDYLHFMHSSRRLLIGCYSPFSLSNITLDAHGNMEQVIRVGIIKNALSSGFRNQISVSTSSWILPSLFEL